MSTFQTASARFISALVIVLMLICIAFQAHGVGCEGVLAGVANADVSRGHSVGFERDFPEANRRFVVYRYQLLGKLPGERNRDKIVRLLFVLQARDTRKVIWKFEEMFKHQPTSVALSPENPDVVYIAKTVEMLALPQDAPPHAVPHRDYIGLSSSMAYEVLRVYPYGDSVRISDLYTTDKSIVDIKVEPDRVLITTKDGVVQVITEN